jgi:hypothetical protein
MVVMNKRRENVIDAYYEIKKKKKSENYFSNSPVWQEILV